MERSVLGDPVLQSLASSKSCSVAQICVAWGLQRGYVVIPKSGNVERVQRNFEIVTLNEEEMVRVGGISKTVGSGDGTGKRFVNPVGVFGFDIWSFWGEK